MVVENWLTIIDNIIHNSSQSKILPNIVNIFLKRETIRNTKELYVDIEGSLEALHSPEYFSSKFALKYELFRSARVPIKIVTNCSAVRSFFDTAICFFLKTSRDAKCHDKQLKLHDSTNLTWMHSTTCITLQWWFPWYYHLFIQITSVCTSDVGITKLKVSAGPEEYGVSDLGYPAFVINHVENISVFVTLQNRYVS